MTRLTWYDGLSLQQQRRVREIIAAAAEADGVAPVGESVLAELGRSRTRHLLATDDDGVIVGYLNRTPEMAELVVDPPARWRLTPRCCCSTNRSAPWTTGCARTCAAGCAACTTPRG
ncbi:hypothetical protein H7H37_17260 [Mycolicibacterium insubricum]|nr:hypothetical protein [Mycolicibacterium insubricum]